MLYVVRHGETSWNVEKRTMGWMDIRLNEAGKEQAKELGEKLKEKNIDLIITSPLSRTKETAKIINEGRNVEIKEDFRIIERGMGSFECRHYPSFEENARLWDLKTNTDENYVETMQKFKDRVFECMDEIVDKYQDKDILIVTHGGVTALINCYFSNQLDDEPLSNKFLKNGEIKEYKIKKNKTRVLTPNNMI